MDVLQNSWFCKPTWLMELNRCSSKWREMHFWLNIQVSCPTPLPQSTSLGRHTLPLQSFAVTRPTIFYADRRLWVDLFVCVSAVYNKTPLLRGNRASPVAVLPPASCLYRPVSCVRFAPWQDACRLPPPRLVCVALLIKSVALLCFFPSPFQYVPDSHFLLFHHYLNPFLVLHTRHAFTNGTV